MTGIFNNFVTPYHDLIIFVTPLFFMKKFYDPQLFHGPPYSVQNDSPLIQVLFLWDLKVFQIVYILYMHQCVSWVPSMVGAVL